MPLDLVVCFGTVTLSLSWLLKKLWQKSLLLYAYEIYLEITNHQSKVTENYSVFDQ